KKQTTSRYCKNACVIMAINNLNVSQMIICKIYRDYESNEKKVANIEQQSETMLSRTQPHRMRFYYQYVDLGILDPYCRINKRPSIFTKDFYRVLREDFRYSILNWACWIKITQSMGFFERVKYYDEFKMKALKMYTDLNQNFADIIVSGDLKALKTIRLKFELKAREEYGNKYYWKYHGLIDDPKYQCIRYYDTGLAQLIIKLHTKQCIVVFDREGRLISGDPKEIKNIIQYVVFQRKMGEKGDWAIYGYYNPEALTKVFKIDSDKNKLISD
ncbi:36270_t:CDS:2, partial [Racocetra persica]